LSSDTEISHRKAILLRQNLSNVVDRKQERHA
jgi:hypothetical protein